jgi:DNA-binding LacI/PurR family transcriptional regulator
MRLPSIAPDHRLIGQCAARYLFDMGHRAVMNVMCLRRYTMELRLGGSEAWRARNLRFTASAISQVANFSARETEEQVGSGLTAYRANLPTAFLVGGDFMAAGTVSALQKRGLRVPQDVSVMSIDGFNLAAIQDVPLTAHVPRDELGSEAVHLLQQRLMRPEAPHGSLLLHGTLVVRDSVRRIRPGKRRTAVEPQGLYDD